MKPFVEVQLVTCGRKQYDRYLGLVGYMFEQSIPLRGIPFKHPLTYNKPSEILTKVLEDRPLYVKREPDPLYMVISRMFFDLWIYDISNAWLDGKVEIRNIVEVLYE